MPEKEQYSINTDMLQVSVGGRRGTSSLQLSRLQIRHGRDTKEEIAERTQGYNGKGVLFQPHHPRTILRCAMHQHTATAAASVAEEDRIMAITKILLKLMKQNGRCKYDSAGERRQQL
jgi:hypothetical protein